MNLTNKQIRERARHLLDDNVFGKDWLKSVVTIFLTMALVFVIIYGAILVTALVVGLLSALLVAILPGANQTLITVIAYLVVVLVEALVGAGISGNAAIGLAYVNLDLVRGDGSISIRKFLDGFRNFADHFMLGFMWSLQIALWSLLIIPGFYVTYSYALAFHIKADHPEYHWRDCLDESERLMSGNRWRLFKLHLSFFGWIILGTLAFAGIGELWAVGYEQTSTAIFYEQVKAEKDNLMDEYGMSTSGPVVYSR